VTGKMVVWYNATLYPKECQSCQHPVEDQTHFLKGAQPDLTGGISSEIHFAKTMPLQKQIQCLWKSCWKASCDGWLRPHTPIRVTECHRTPRITQATIGWDQMLYEQWSEHWRILQQQHLYNNNISCNPRNNDIDRVIDWSWIGGSWWHNAPYPLDQILSPSAGIWHTTLDSISGQPKRYPPCQQWNCLV
jgi:hypothetical protein